MNKFFKVRKGRMILSIILLLFLGLFYYNLRLIKIGKSVTDVSGTFADTAYNFVVTFEDTDGYYNYQNQKFNFKYYIEDGVIVIDTDIKILIVYDFLLYFTDIDEFLYLLD